MDVGAIRNDDDLVASDAALGEHLGDGARHRDHGGGASVLPTRADVAAEPKIDAAGNDKWHVHPERRQRSQAGGVRGVGMHNLDTPRTEVAAQSQHAARVGLERGCAWQELDALRGRSLGQWFARTRRHDRNVLATRQLGS